MVFNTYKFRRIILIAYDKVHIIPAEDSLSNAVVTNKFKSIYPFNIRLNSLSGGEGDDKYIVNLSDGVNVISDVEGVDTLELIGNYGIGETVFSRDDMDLVISYQDDPTKFIRIEDHMGQISQRKQSNFQTDLYIPWTI